MNDRLIKDRVVLITGASSGIGECIARYLAKRGAIVILGARRLERLQVIVSEIRASGGTAYCTRVDVTSHDEVNQFVQFALNHAGKLDVIVNNAGVMHTAPIDELKVAEWSQMINTNIFGVLHGIAAALPVFKEQGYGHFINIASVAGFKVASPGGTVYSASKFAVRAISEGLRHEVGGAIRTCLISPGAIESELKFGGSHLESKKRILNFYENIAINAEHIARAVYFAITMSPEVDVNEIVIRPTYQDF